jgi:signal transduction histidine kinase
MTCSGEGLIERRQPAHSIARDAGPERLVWASDCPFAGHEGQITYRETIDYMYSDNPQVMKDYAAFAGISESLAKRVRDPVLSFQLRNGFEVIGVLRDYLDDDRHSLNYAAHMVWYNPKVPQGDEKQVKKYGVRMPDVVRIATVQYMLRKVSSFGEFLKHIEDAATHMSQLIDDLLRLSRVTRTQMHYEPVSISEIARAVALPGI